MRVCRVNSEIAQMWSARWADSVYRRCRSVERFRRKEFGQIFVLNVRDDKNVAEREELRMDVARERVRDLDIQTLAATADCRTSGVRQSGSRSGCADATGQKAPLASDQRSSRIERRRYGSSAGPGDRSRCGSGPARSPCTRCSVSSVVRCWKNARARFSNPPASPGIIQRMSSSTRIGTSRAAFSSGKRPELVDVAGREIAPDRAAIAPRTGRHERSRSRASGLESAAVTASASSPVPSATSRFDAVLVLEALRRRWSSRRRTSPCSRLPGFSGGRRIHIAAVRRRPTASAMCARISGHVGEDPDAWQPAERRHTFDRVASDDVKLGGGNARANEWQHVGGKVDGRIDVGRVIHEPGEDDPARVLQLG